MYFNEHQLYKGKHAFLSASSNHWLNYTPEKLEKKYESLMAVKKGTELHEFAAKCIELKQKLSNSKRTLNMYVNDAIGYRMAPEQILFYSPNCFGTADAILFRGNTLRIHDLKTGSTVASMDQLEVYASLFCLEYDKLPENINIELRIYQNDEVVCHSPDPSRIHDIMNTIVEFDKIIEKMKNNYGDID